MARGSWLIALMALTTVVSAVPARAQSDDDRYNIMRPEPWLAPKYRSPRGTLQKPVRLPSPPPVETHRMAPPPPIVMPETRRVLPNLPVVRQGSVPGGKAESFGDRASRCTHQAGVYGVAPDQRGSYIGTCLNQ